MFFGTTSSRMRLRQQAAPITVAQRNGHRLFGLLLPDDIFVQFGYDLPRCQIFVTQSIPPDLHVMIQYLLHDDVVVRIDANFRSDLQALRGRSPSLPSPAHAVSAPARPPAQNCPPEPIASMPSSGSIISPVPRDQQHVLVVHDDHHRFQPTQHPIGAPFFRQLHRRPLQIAVMLLQLAFKLFKQGYRIGDRPGKTGDDFSAV